MDIKKYFEEVKRTLPDLGYRQKNNLHMTMGIATEAGELLDVFKKELAYNKKVDWVNVGEEVGDLMWYIANFCNINGLDFEDILEKNINKLKAR